MKRIFQQKKYVNVSQHGDIVIAAYFSFLVQSISTIRCYSDAQTHSNWDMGLYKTILFHGTFPYIVNELILFLSGDFEMYYIMGNTEWYNLTLFQENHLTRSKHIFTLISRIRNFKFQ